MNDKDGSYSGMDYPHLFATDRTIFQDKLPVPHLLFSLELTHDTSLITLQGALVMPQPPLLRRPPHKV
jgi:hypothetical protein